MASPDDALRDLCDDSRSMPFFWEIALFDERDNGPNRRRPDEVLPESAAPAVVPRADSLFEPVRDRYGWRLALVFGNHAAGGFCPYFTAIAASIVTSGQARGRPSTCEQTASDWHGFKSIIACISLPLTTWSSTIPARFSIRMRCRRNCSMRSSLLPVHCRPFPRSHSIRANLISGEDALRRISSWRRAQDYGAAHSWHRNGRRSHAERCFVQRNAWPAIARVFQELSELATNTGRAESVSTSTS